MQICTISKQEEQEVPKNFFEIYADLVEKHNNVAVLKIDNQDFIIRALGRKDYREIMINQEIDDFLKEEAICEICTLYPENFDFENCDAGIPSRLYEDIVKFSYLDDKQEEERAGLMNYFRHEMIELHNQINCLISEAFPSLSFDEIENFDMVTALKYLSRAEWILQNLRGFEMFSDPFTGKAWEPEQMQPEPVPQSPMPEPAAVQSQSQQNMPQSQQPKVVPPGFDATKSFIPGETIEDRIERLKRGEIQKEQLTPQKLAQLERQYPEVDWRGSQQVSQQDLEANVDTTPMALRTPDQLYRR